MMILQVMFFSGLVGKLLNINTVESHNYRAPINCLLSALDLHVGDTTCCLHPLRSKGRDV